MSDQMIVPWRPRDLPLAPCACVGLEIVVSDLAKCLLQFSDGRLAELRGCHAPGALALVGNEAALPWTEGVVYLGRDPDVPDFLVPTNQRPAVPFPLLAEALRSNLSGSGPWALIPQTHGFLMIDLSHAREMEREHLVALHLSAGADAT